MFGELAQMFCLDDYTTPIEHHFRHLSMVNECELFIKMAFEIQLDGVVCDFAFAITALLDVFAVEIELLFAGDEWRM